MRWKSCHQNFMRQDGGGNGAVETWGGFLTVRIGDWIIATR